MDKNQILQEWETVVVINIHKKGSNSKCKTYRGITLLLTVYKLFINTTTKKFNAQLGEKMAEEECGFRKGCSCVDAVFTVQQII